MASRISTPIDITHHGPIIFLNIGDFQVWQVRHRSGFADGVVFKAAITAVGKPVRATILRRAQQCVGASDETGGQDGE